MDGVCQSPEQVLIHNTTGNAGGGTEAHRGNISYPLDVLCSILTLEIKVKGNDRKGQKRYVGV